MSQDVIIYEQPLNEHNRACLRLEQLFRQFQDTYDQPSEWASRFALQSLLKILNVVDRPDLKSKLTKALSDHAAVLMQLEKRPQVDSEKLRQFLDQLDHIIDQLYALPGKIGQPLSENDFLASIRSHMHNPGGPSNFNIPAYQQWLNKSVTIRQHDLQLWYQEFALVERAVKMLLQLTRDFAKRTSHTADQGFYQQALDPNSQGEMIRILLDSNSPYFPEISVGRHRLSVRFLTTNLLQKPRQTEDNVSFKMLYCAL